MVSVMLRQAIGSNGFQFLMLRRCVDDERRKHLLHDVAVFLEHQSEELLGIMGYKVDLQPIINARLLNGFMANFQPKDFFQRQEMHPRRS